MEVTSVTSHWVRIGSVLAMLLILGCQTAPLAQDEPVRPYSAVRGRPRSIVFHSVSLRALTDAAGIDAHPSTLPWYVSRNDQRLTAFAGYHTATTDQLVNITYDRQTISGGQSRDHYHNTTYRQTVSQTVR